MYMAIIVYTQSHSRVHNALAKDNIYLVYFEMASHFIYAGVAKYVKSNDSVPTTIIMNRTTNISLSAI